MQYSYLLKFLTVLTYIMPWNKNLFLLWRMSMEALLFKLSGNLRKCHSVKQRNQRLAALKTFADYAGIQRIEYLAPLQMVQGIKSKKTSPRENTFLPVEQMSLLINIPDANTKTGLRHRVVLTLLYDSGCRVQELCDIQIRDIHTGSNPTVRLH